MQPNWIAGSDEKVVTEEKIQLGRINAAYGLKGWVKIYSHTDPVEQILSYTPWQLRKDGKEFQVEVAKGKVHGKGVIALLKGFEDRDHAESLIGHEVWIDRARLPQLEAGEYYWNQLEGLDVINQSGVSLGRVDHLMETGANDVLVVRPDTGSFDDKERLIPYVVGEVVKEVNLETAVIVVSWETDY
jgi:16S rRNA processing protein RimM